MDTVRIVYWTSTGNTEEMANLVAQGVTESGKEAEVLYVGEASAADIAQDEVIVLGASAMGDEELDDEMEDFFTELIPHLSGKKVALFGSYSWNNGEWMDIWSGRAADAGATVIGTAIAYEMPEGTEADACVELGKTIAQA